VLNPTDQALVLGGGVAAVLAGCCNSVAIISQTACLSPTGFAATVIPGFVQEYYPYGCDLDFKFMVVPPSVSPLTSVTPRC
jgi:hypothetical protein